jgi:hypothetical protein
MAGLLDNEEDLDAYLRRLMTGTRTVGGGGNIGPLAVNVSQDYAANPQRALEVLERQPDVRAADIGYTHTFSPGVQARINAAVNQQPGQEAMIQPGASLNLGPLSLSGGVNIQRRPDQETGDLTTKVVPRFGAGMTVPLFGGDASVNATITPGEAKAIAAGWRKKILGDRGDIGITGTYSQPTYGDPQWGVGIGGKIRF